MSENVCQLPLNVESAYFHPTMAWKCKNQFAHPKNEFTFELVASNFIPRPSTAPGYIFFFIFFKDIILLHVAQSV